MLERPHTTPLSLRKRRYKHPRRISGRWPRGAGCWGNPSLFDLYELAAAKDCPETSVSVLERSHTTPLSLRKRRYKHPRRISGMWPAAADRCALEVKTEPPNPRMQLWPGCITAASEASAAKADKACAGMPATTCHYWPGGSASGPWFKLPNYLDSLVTKLPWQRLVVTAFPLPGPCGAVNHLNMLSFM